MNKRHRLLIKHTLWIGSALLFVAALVWYGIAAIAYPILSQDYEQEAIHLTQQMFQDAINYPDQTIVYYGVGYTDCVTAIRDYNQAHGSVPSIHTLSNSLTMKNPFRDTVEIWLEAPTDHGQRLAIKVYERSPAGCVVVPETVSHVGVDFDSR